MDAQEDWMMTHPGASKEALSKHLLALFPEYAMKGK
jgi:hypothetical protein